MNIPAGHRPIVNTTCVANTGSGTVGVVKLQSDGSVTVWTTPSTTVSRLYFCVAYLTA